MGKRPKGKMPLEQRAKQFAPFDALKGFSDAIRNTEGRRFIEERIKLSEDQLADLDERIHSVKKGDRITITYYCNGHYVSFSGKFEKLDELFRMIQVSGQKLLMDDIIMIEF